MTPFFKRLIKMSKTDNAIFEKTKMGAYVAYVKDGPYWGVWILHENKTIWATFGEALQGQHLALAARMWPGRSFGSAVSKAGPMKPNLLRQAVFLREYFADYDGFSAVELMIMGYLGKAGIDRWWQMHEGQRARLENYFKSNMFAKLGVGRRQTVMRRFFENKEKQAWTRTYRLHPAVNNKVRALVMEGKESILYIEDRNFMRWFRPMGPHHDVTMIARIKEQWILDRSDAPLFLSAAQWAYRHPGQLHVLLNFLREINNITRTSWGLEDIREMLEIYTPVSYEGVTPEHLQRLHDNELTMLQTAVVDARRDQAEKRKERASIFNKEREARRQALAPVFAVWEAAAALYDGEWARVHDSMDPGEFPGIRLLRTREDYVVEGQTMHHCVAGYYKHSTILPVDTTYVNPEHVLNDKMVERAKAILDSDVMWSRRHTQVYHIDGSDKGGTMAVEMLTTGSEWVVRQTQFLGVCNKPVAKDTLDKAKEFFAHMGWDTKTVRGGHN